MPLEEEIASLKSKLKNANDKISVLETKQEKKPAKVSFHYPVNSNITGTLPPTGNLKLISKSRPSLSTRR